MYVQLHTVRPKHPSDRPVNPEWLKITNLCYQLVFSAFISKAGKVLDGKFIGDVKILVLPLEFSLFGAKIYIS